MCAVAGVRSGFLFERLVSIQSDDGRASAFASPRSNAGLEEQLLPMTSDNAVRQFACRRKGFMAGQRHTCLSMASREAHAPMMPASKQLSPRLQGGVDGAGVEDAVAEEDDYDDGEEGMDSGGTAAAGGAAANGGSASGVAGTRGDEEAGVADGGSWFGDEQRPLLPPSADATRQQATQGERHMFCTPL